MAETGPVGTENATTGDGDRPGLPTVPGPAEGEPISEVPPLVEFEGRIDDPSAARESAAMPAPSLGRRPVRRRFLAPVAEGDFPHSETAAETREVRPRASGRGAPPPTSGAAFAISERPRERVEPGDDTARTSPRRVRRWPRYLAAGGGIALALLLAVGAEIGVNPRWVARLRGTVAQMLAQAPGVAAAGKPPADPAKRVAYYTARANAGDGESQFALAVLYARGEGVAQDYAAAAKWFRAAADHGMARAQYDLGVLYERGRGVSLDFAEAAAWYRRAAERNYALAQYNLAVAYTKGQGVARDPAEAASWYRRAAAQGVVAAMLNLAILYERGDGVAASTVDAYAWYRAAARRGSQPAARRADELLKAFSPTDQTRAEAMTTAVAESIRDPIGAAERQGTQKLPAAAPAVSGAPGGPVLKSGIDNGPAAPHDSEVQAETP